MTVRLASSLLPFDGPASTSEGSNGLEYVRLLTTAVLLGTWYPLGRVTGGTLYPGLMVTSGVIYHILRLLSLPVDIRNICVLLAPGFSGLTAFATYLFTAELTPSPSAGLLAAAFMGITPGYISRSVAGSYDNEAIAIFLLMFTFYLWIKALKLGSAFWGALTALFYFYMVSAWGGYVFITNLIPLHALVLVIMGRFSPRLYVSYSSWYALGTLMSMQVPFVGFLPIRTSEHMAALGKELSSAPLSELGANRLVRCLRITPNRCIRGIRSTTSSQQAIPDSPSIIHTGGLRPFLWRLGSPDSFWSHCSLDWTILLFVGYWICQDSHTNHCFRLGTSAHCLACLLLRSQFDDLAVPRWYLHVLQDPQG